MDLDEKLKDEELKEIDKNMKYDDYEAFKKSNGKLKEFKKIRNNK